MSKIYYEEPGIQIYCGDCREILPELEPVDSIITDPVWPNATVPLYGAENPEEMLRQALAAYHARARRVVVHLGCDSDPRFLAAIPEFYPFLRVCWLRYARPSYKGRLLNGSDVAYVFGTPPPPGEFTVMAGESKTEGEVCHTNPRDGGRGFGAHPTTRRLSHVKWLVKWFGGQSIIDPFVGAGTSLCAAKAFERKAIGIEVEEKYCEIAAERVRQTPKALPYDDSASLTGAGEAFLPS